MIRLHRERMPAKRKQPLGLYLLDRDLEGHPFVRLLFLGDRGVCLSRNNHPMERRTGHERTVELHSKPCPEFFGIGNGAPNPFARRAENDALIYLVSVHMQLYGCIIPNASKKRQPTSCK